MADQRPQDEQRIEGWAREHSRAVRGYLWAMTRRTDVADDLWQEVLCRAWQARTRYQEQGNARAYLLRIADRLVCDRARRAEPSVNLTEEGWSQHEPADATSEPAAELAQTEEMRRLSLALDQVSAVQQRVLLLRYYGEFSFDEIAETIGCPLNTTLSHCRRGLETLRKLLGKDHESTGRR